MNKIREIVGAWITSFNPDEDEKKLAEKRYEICFLCEHRKESPIGQFCGKCGCPLSKKVFTHKTEDSCPVKKWDEVDKDFRKLKLQKNKYKLF